MAQSKKRHPATKSLPSKSWRVWWVRIASGAVVLGACGGAAYYYRAQQAQQQKRVEGAAFGTWNARAPKLDEEFDVYMSCMDGGVTTPARDGARVQKLLARVTAGGFMDLARNEKDICGPPLRARLGDWDKLESVPAVLARPWKEYRETLRSFLDEMARYASGRSQHAKEAGQQEQMLRAATDWSATNEVSEGAARFERFFGCAVPTLASLKDKDELMLWFSQQCTDGKADGYVGRLELDCLPLLDGDAGAAAPVAGAEGGAARFRQAKLRGVGVASMMLSACAEHVRRVWLSTDGQPLAKTADDFFSARRRLNAAIGGLVAKPASSG